MTVGAAALIARVRADQPQVVMLARMLALAANVDVALVRRMRRTLLREADVRVEADLWASPLVDVRATAELRLRSDVQQVFWDELKGDRAALDVMWAALAAARTNARPLLALEEKLTYLAVKGDVAAVEQELGSVIQAMLAEGDRRRDLAAWSARALARLPAAVRETEAARVLATAARTWVATPTQVAELTPTPEGARLAMRMMHEGRRVSLHLRLVGHMLEVGGAPIEPFVTIEVPASAPSIILDEDRVVPVDPRVMQRIALARPEVMIGTLDGRRWSLHAIPPRPNLEAIGVCHGLGSSCVAYLIAPNLAVTSARSFGERVRRIDVSFAEEFVSSQLVAVDRVADVALLALSQTVSVTPLVLADEVRRGDACQVHGPDFVVGSAELPRWLGPWNGSLIADSRLRFFGERPDLNLLPAGMPVFQGTQVVGHMRSVSRDGGIHLATARSVAWWQARVAGSGEYD